jgi:large subunit ribosomal protein L10Ae
VRPNLRIALIGDQHDIDRAKYMGLDTLDKDNLLKLSKNRKLINKLVQEYDAFIVSASLMSQIPRLMGPGLMCAGRFPVRIEREEELGARIKEVKSTMRFQLRKEVCLGAVVRHVDLTEEELLANVMLAIHFVVSLTKKGWASVGSLTVKSIMSPPRRLYEAGC